MLCEIKAILRTSADLIYHQLFINDSGEKPATLIYIEGLVNATMIDSHVLKPLSQNTLLGSAGGDQLIERIAHGTVYHCSIKVRDSVQDVVRDVLAGNAVLVIGGLGKAVMFEVKGFQMRGIGAPTSENVVKGGKDAFIEVLRVNTGIIRRRIQSPNLRIRELPVGTQVQTGVAVIYMEDAADPAVVRRVMDRLQKAAIAAIQSPGNIEEQISDHRFSIFPQSIYTERPDRLCANVLEGKVGILIDGYPIAYIAPVVFNALFQSGEDYVLNYIQSSLLRLLRYVCAFASLMLPGLYVSIVTFHNEMLPVSLLASIIKAKESVPITSLLEVIFMLIAFEILLEAGVRLPKSIGQAISIIGGLVVGDAAVSAKFVSPAVVVVVAITGICGFIIPNPYLSNSFRLLRMVLVLVSGFLGLYGLSLAMIMIVYSLFSMTSLHIPFMTPAYPQRRKWALRDGFLRLPVRRGQPGAPQ